MLILFPELNWHLSMFSLQLTSLAIATESFIPIQTAFCLKTLLVCSGYLNCPNQLDKIKMYLLVPIRHISSGCFILLVTCILQIAANNYSCHQRETDHITPLIVDDEHFLYLILTWTIIKYADALAHPVSQSHSEFISSLALFL